VGRVLAMATLISLPFGNVECLICEGTNGGHTIYGRLAGRVRIARRHGLAVPISHRPFAPFGHGVNHFLNVCAPHLCRHFRPFLIEIPI
jgi:hypothetical protein